MDSLNCTILPEEVLDSGPKYFPPFGVTFPINHSLVLIIQKLEHALKTIWDSTVVSEHLTTSPAFALIW